jgi:hypothetical protein
MDEPVTQHSLSVADVEVLAERLVAELQLPTLGQFREFVRDLLLGVADFVPNPANIPPPAPPAHRGR